MYYTLLIKHPYVFKMSDKFVVEYAEITLSVDLFSIVNAVCMGERTFDIWMLWQPQVCIWGIGN